MEFQSHQMTREWENQPRLTPRSGYRGNPYPLPGSNPGRGSTRRPFQDIQGYRMQDQQVQRNSPIPSPPQPPPTYSPPHPSFTTSPLIAPTGRPSTSSMPAPLHHTSSNVRSEVCFPAAVHGLRYCTRGQGCRFSHIESELEAWRLANPDVVRRAQQSQPDLAVFDSINDEMMEETMHQMQGEDIFESDSDGPPPLVDDEDWDTEDESHLYDSSSPFYH